MTDPEDDDADSESLSPKELVELHAESVKRFKRYAEAWAGQREEERTDLRFQIPRLQWADDDRKFRENRGSDTYPLPPRPVLSIPKLAQPIQLVRNQEAQAELSVSIHPLSADSDQDTADAIEGLYRKIQRDSQASKVRSWAFDRAVQAGMGFYLVNSRYSEDGNPFDQDITIERILYQANVFPDPAATKYDFSDGEAAYITAWMPIAQFKREFPGKPIPTSDSHFDANIVVPEWVKEDSNGSAVLVAWEFYKKHDMVSIALLPDGSVVPSEQIPKGVTPLKERLQDQVSVWSCKHSALGIVEGPTKTDGKYIPIVVLIGNELQPFDEKRYWVGMIGPAKDAQRFHNVAASSLVERMQMEPKAPFIVAEGQLEGYTGQWQQANVRNFPFLEHKQIDVRGQPAPPPARAQIDSTGMSIAAEALQISDGWVQAITSTFDASLGKLSQKDRSGIAIARQQSQSDASNSHYIQNLAAAMNYEARVVLDLIPKKYDAPGRVVRILGEEDKTETVMLNQPFTVDPNTKQPQAVTPGPAGQPLPPKAKTYDLTKGVYSVSIKIGKSAQTKLEAGSEAIGQMLQAQPNLFPLFGATWLRYQDFPGAKEMADIATRARDQQFPGIATKPDDPASPEQLQAELQKKDQQIQRMQQALQQLQQAQQTDQAKQQATIQKAQIDAQTQAGKAQLDAQTSQAKAAADNQTKAATASLDSQTKLQVADLQAKVDLIIQSMKHEHEKALAEFQAAHQVAAGAVQHDQNLEAGAVQHEQSQQAAADQGQRDAAAQKVDLTFRGSAKEPLSTE